MKPLCLQLYQISVFVEILWHVIMKMMLNLLQYTGILWKNSNEACHSYKSFQISVLSQFHVWWIFRSTTFELLSAWHYNLISGIMRPHYSEVILGAIASQITSLTIVYSIVYSRHRSKKTSKLRVTGLCTGKSIETGEFPAQMVSKVEKVPMLMTSSCLRPLSM